MDIAFVQTAVGDAYVDLLAASSRTVRAYCERRPECTHEAFIGVKRGFHPWQSSFNRIYLLQELLERGRHDWAVYLDADAYVGDLDFDLPRYLEGRSDRLGVLTRSGSSSRPWDVNSGVIMLNLRHPFTERLLAAWRGAYEAISDATLRGWPDWTEPNDQHLLHDVLREDPDLLASLHLAPRRLFNGLDSRFTRQMLRAHYPDPKLRLKMMRARVAETLGAPPSAENLATHTQAEALVHTVYRATLRREADPSGLAAFAPLVNRLGAERATQAMLEQITASPEFAAATLTPVAGAPDPRSGSTAFDPPRFVGELYEALLGRPADPAGLEEKIARLRAGTATPGELIAECLASQEFVDRASAFVRRMDLQPSLGLLNDVTQFGELELLLKRWLEHTAAARLVVDVGARGRERSNSYDLCRSFGWRALLIEANPALIAGLHADFAGLDVSVVNCAVSDHEGRAMLTLGANADVSSLNAAHAAHWGPTQGEVEVELRRLPDILAAQDAPARFDLLSLDIEGEDLKVLNDLVADGRYAADWVLIEASYGFATKSLEDIDLSPQVREAYALVGQTAANLLLRRR